MLDNQGIRVETDNFLFLAVYRLAQSCEMENR
jgi:hypothetical protein